MKLWEGMAAPLLHWLSLNFIYLLEKNLKKNSTLSLHDVDEGRSMEYLLTRFQDEIKSSSNEIVLRKQNLLAAISEYVFWKEFHCLLPSFLVCWKNFFSMRVFFTDTDDSQGNRGSEGTIFYSNLPLPPAGGHWDIYLQLCMWDDYHVLSIATLVFNRLLLDEI